MLMLGAKESHQIAGNRYKISAMCQGCRKRQVTSVSRRARSIHSEDENKDRCAAQLGYCTFARDKERCCTYA